MGITPKGVVQTVAAIAIPLCLSTIVIVLVESFFADRGDFTNIGVFLCVMNVGPLAGFAIIVRAFESRGRLFFAAIGAVYFPLWWSFLLLYWLILSMRLAYYWCTDPRPGACWP